MLSLSPRTKSILLLISTLLLGMVLGAVVNAWLAAERFERIPDLRRPGGVVRHLDRVLEPQSDAQRAQIRTVLDATSAEVQTLREAHRRELRAVLDSMKIRLEPILTDEQMSTLQNRLRMGPPGPRVPPHRGRLHEGRHRGR